MTEWKGCNYKKNGKDVYRTMYTTDPAVTLVCNTS